MCLFNAVYLSAFLLIRNVSCVSICRQMYTSHLVSMMSNNYFTMTLQYTIILFIIGLYHKLLKQTITDWNSQANEFTIFIFLSSLVCNIKNTSSPHLKHRIMETTLETSSKCSSKNVAWQLIRTKVEWKKKLTHIFIKYIYIHIHA